MPPSSTSGIGRPGDRLLQSASITSAASPKYRQDNRSKTETDALIARIRKTVTTAAKTSSKDDCITTLITSCIEQGFDIGPRIIGISRALGFNAQHTGIILNRGAGDKPGQHRWYKDQQGRYQLG